MVLVANIDDRVSDISLRKHGKLIDSWLVKHSKDESRDLQGGRAPSRNPKPETATTNFNRLAMCFRFTRLVPSRLWW